jgi:hypothetical protein
MKKIITIILIMISNFSCTEKKEIISENDIIKFAKGNYMAPSKYGALELYVLTVNDEIIISNADYLNFVYVNHYKNAYICYKDFLSELLNQKIKINKSEFERIPYKSFRINERIKKEYEKLNFKDFFNKHAKYIISFEKSNYLNINRNASSDEIKTILYYFYLNGYQIIRGDSFPRYYIYSRNKLMN